MLSAQFQFHLLQRFGPEQAPIVSVTPRHATPYASSYLRSSKSVQRCALGHIDSLHGDHIQTENFASSKAYDETLHLLAVNGVGPGLDAQRVVGARKTQHFFHFRVECYAVGVIFFKQQLFSFQLVHQTRILFVNHRQFTFGHGQIKASDTALDVATQQNWKWVVHEHLVNRTIFQANQHPFAAIGASNDFYVSNDRFHDPLSLLLARKGEQLQLLPWHKITCWLVMTSKLQSNRLFIRPYGSACLQTKISRRLFQCLRYALILGRVWQRWQGFTVLAGVHCVWNEIGMRECEERIDFEHPHPCFAGHYLLPSFITSYRIMRSGNCTASLSLYTAIFFT